MPTLPCAGRSSGAGDGPIHGYVICPPGTCDPSTAMAQQTRATLRSGASCRLSFRESGASLDSGPPFSLCGMRRRPGPGEQTPPAPDPVNRRVLHDPSTHNDASVFERRFRLPYGNESRRSQSRGSTGSQCLRLLHSWARMIHRSIGTDPRTQASQMPGGIVGASGFVAGATEPDWPSPEQPPCCFGVLGAATHRPPAAEASADRATPGPHSLAAHAPSAVNVDTRPGARHETLVRMGDETVICLCEPRAEARTPESGPTERRTGRARSDENIPPETPTPSLLATVLNIPTPGQPSRGATSRHAFILEKRTNPWWPMGWPSSIEGPPLSDGLCCGPDNVKWKMKENASFSDVQCKPCSPQILPCAAASPPGAG
jgi:hypothetical protein